ncbi:unnamed protein product [Psylliodes chrysocephalus]|uniref:DUF4817 domain-containing protein n=1 Tax=Psylliodes chrysocephalus TaxID=3402493 RepID=A0A9P0CJ12_9CUCU|nr:unnamed protein product [Psylliodes chrysocephala]
MDLQTRIDLVQCYYECGRNYTTGLRRFRAIMGLRAEPCQMKAYRYLIQKFERAGSVIDLPRSGRPGISDAQVVEVLHKNQDIARGKFTSNQQCKCDIQASANAVNHGSENVTQISKNVSI